MLGIRGQITPNPLTLASRLLRWAVRVGVPRVTPHVVREIRLDQRPFTQGLAIHDNLLYLSSGGDRNSYVIQIDLQSGQLRKQVAIHDDFAEGLAVVADRLVVLSWKSGIARVFNLPDLVPAGIIHYDGEGWGLASHGDRFVMSDGTSRLRYRDDQFQPIATLQVHSRRLPVRRINDLEWVAQRIYANLWTASAICEIASQSGRLLRLIDCTAIARQFSDDDDAILNGIAYCRERGTLFIGGKRWDRVVEIAIPDFVNAQH